MANYPFRADLLRVTPYAPAEVFATLTGAQLDSIAMVTPTLTQTSLLPFNDTAHRITVQRKVQVRVGQKGTWRMWSAAEAAASMGDTRYGAIYCVDDREDALLVMQSKARDGVVPIHVSLRRASSLLGMAVNIRAVVAVLPAQR